MHSFVLVALLAWAQGSAMTLADVEAEASLTIRRFEVSNSRYA